MSKLDGVHPDLVQAIQRIFGAMEAFGKPMKVVEGVRSAQRQQELYAQGRTKPGKIVTNADGVNKKSNHQAKADGFGHAVDCAFVDDPRTPRDETYDESQPWIVYGTLAEACGLQWGGRWRDPYDRPHIELKES